MAGSLSPEAELPAEEQDSREQASSPGGCEGEEPRAVTWGLDDSAQAFCCGAGDWVVDGSQEAGQMTLVDLRHPDYRPQSASHDLGISPLGLTQPPTFPDSAAACHENHRRANS